MGKQTTEPIYLSQEEYDKKLDTEIGVLVDKGFSDEDIQLYGEDFKSMYAVKKKDEEAPSEALPLDGARNVTTSTSVSDQQLPNRGPDDAELTKSLLEAGLTKEQIELSKRLQESAPLGEIAETYTFQQEAYPTAERAGIEGFEGEIAPTEVQIAAEELRPQVDLAQQETTLSVFKQLRDKGEISEDEYKEVEESITRPTKERIAKFEKIREKYNPQRMIDLTNKFKQVGILSNSEVNAIDTEVDRRRRGDFTLLEKGKMALGFAFSDDIKKVTKADRDAMLQARIRQKQADFLSDLDNDERVLFESYLVKRNEKLNETVKNAENFNDNIVKVALPTEAAQLRAYDAQMAQIQNKPREQVTEQDINTYNELLTRRKEKEAVINSLGEQYEANRKTMLDNEDDLMQFGDELDMAKRDYSFYGNRIKAVDRGFQFLAENAVAFAGNSLTTIAREIPRTRQTFGDENLQKAQDIFNAWQINIAETKEKFESGIAPRKSFADVNNVSDFGSYVGDLMTDQVPILATIYATGGAGTVGVGLASGGERTGQLLKEVKEGKKDYTQAQIIGNGLLYAGGEFIGERITLGIMNDYRRLLNSVNKSGAAKSTFREAVKKQVQGTLKGLSTANQEGLSEVYTEFIQLLADNVQLDENRSSQFLESYVGGFVMGKGMHVTGTIPNMALGAYTKYQNRQEVEKRTRQIMEFEKVLTEGNLTDAVKSTYQQKIIDLMNDNQNTIFQSVDAIQYLDSGQLREITGINKQLIEVQKSLQENNTDEVKNMLNSTMKQLVERKDKILSTPQEQLDALPDKGLALKEQASQILTKEKQDAGLKEFQISDTEITFKAAELLSEQETSDLGIEVEPVKSNVSEDTKNFVEGLGVLKDVSEFVDKTMKVIVDDVSVMIGEADNGNVILESIYVPRNQRGQGKGSQVLDSLIERADEQGKTMELVVAPLDDNITFSGLIKLYESKGFVKEEGFVEDGGKMYREPKVETGFEAIDIALAEAPTEVVPEVTPEAQPTAEFTPQPTVETRANTYDISVQDGELQITPQLGEPTITPRERQNIINEYLDQTDFDQGTRADFEGKGTLTDTQVSEVIAKESNNPLEVAQEIVRAQDAAAERVQQLEATKDDAIANVLKSYPLTQDAKTEVTDLGRYYTNKANKPNDPIGIDRARELAESELGAEVSFQDVLDFLNQYPSITQYNETLSDKVPEIAELKDRFKQLTGLEATDANISKIVEKQPEVTEEVAEEVAEPTDEVPFQVESKQTRIAGAELSGLVNRLKQTGLADDVVIQSDSQIQKTLEDLGVDADILKQVDANYNEKQKIKDDAIKDGTFLKATNGKDTNLTEEQWLSTRTKNFKDWFGDWQNDPANASKVLDENGEPLVVYHGTFYDFNEFTRKNYNESNKNDGFHFGTLRTAYEILELRSEGFDPNLSEKEQAKVFKEYIDKNANILKSFLNIRNIAETTDEAVDPEGRSWSEIIPDVRKETNADGIQYTNEVEGFGDTSYIVFDANQIKSAENNIGIFSKESADFRFQRELSENNITMTPNGFVHNNIVYLNRNKVKKDTPIHEFGHLWNSYIKENNVEAYNRGLELIKFSEYHKDVIDNPSYSNLNEEQQLEEALAQAIGEKGVKILNESKKRKFSQWFRSLFSKIAAGLGLRKMSGDKLANLTLEQYTDLAGGELLAGIEIREGRAPAPKKGEIADVSQIDVIVAERQATIKERQRLKELANAKKSVTKDVKNKLVDYINEQLNKKNLSQAQKSDVRKLLTIVKNAKTKTNLLRGFERANEVFTKLENKVLLDGINDILDKKLTKKEGGRRKANLVTEEVATILTNVKKNIKAIPKEVTIPAKQSTKNRINEALRDLFERRDAIMLKENQTDADYLELESLIISIDILSGMVAENSNTTNQNYTEALGNLASIYENGRSELKAMKEKRDQQDQELLKDVINDVNPEGKRTIKTEREIDADRKKITNTVKRFLFQAGSGWFSGNLDSIMTILSRRKGESREDSPLVQLVNEMKSKETGKKRRVSIFSNRVVQAQKDLFGSVRKSDIALNKMNKVKVSRRPPGADPATPKLEEELTFSNSQLLNLWMNNHNPKLKAGLEANGFDAKFFEQVEQILPANVKEYGESLFNIYDDLHYDSDKVYKEMNFHSMGKEDFYAGKVYRSDVEMKPEDLKIDAGNYSINTTGFGSQKERTANDKPIEAMDVNMLIMRSIGETSHYVAFAEVHRKYAKILKDKGFKQAVNATNKTNGDLIFNLLNFYKERDLERGGYRGNAILDTFGRNIARSTLALKAKIGVTQTVSFFNGGIDMPELSATEYVKYYNPVEVVKTMRYLMKESDYLKNRYDLEGIESAMSGLSSVAAKSEFSLTDNTLEANRKAASRFINQAFNIALANVKYGDMAGVTGGVPAYMAWKDKYKKQGLSDEQAHQKALKRFESSIDRSQQTTSTFGKSPFQKHPVGRYFAMFATAPIQNLQNANYHWRELYRNLAKEGTGKGSNFKNIMGIMNYQFAQPMLYTYISQLMAGSLAAAIGIGDEEPDDLDKSLLSSAILSNYGSVPVFGSIATGIVDNAIGKEFSYGGLISSAFFSSTDKLNDDLNKWMKAKTRSESVKYRNKSLKQMSALFLGVPSMVTDTFMDFDEIYWNDDVDQTVKMLKAMGYSDYLIEQSMTPRLTRTEAAKKRRKLERKYKKSIRKYDKKKVKVVPVFRKKDKKVRRR